jgi:L-threonylcarbamoyladenylate synthase
VSTINNKDADAMARVIRISEDSCLSQNTRKTVKKILENDGVIVYPTDTLYGLGTRLTERGIEKIFELKNRPRNKKFPILISESHNILRLIKTNSTVWNLVLKYWPGPLTIVAEASEQAPKPIRYWGHIGVRLPGSCIARELARLAGGCIIGTSANRSGRPTPSTIDKIMAEFGEEVDLYIDAGPRAGPASTVVMIEEGRIKLLREGAIKM